MNQHVVKIGSREIGPDRPCYLITEVGTTCLGNMDYALELVNAAADAGMDAVKFQVIDPEQLSDASVRYQFSAGGRKYSANMKDMFEKLHFSDDDWRRIRDACHHRGVDFFATVDYEAGVDLLDSLDVPVHKMGAWDVTFQPLVARIGATGKPLIVDLGPATAAQMADLEAWYCAAGGTAVMYLHDFHTGDRAQMNMRALTHLAETAPWPFGYSSPARDDDLDLLALGLGAQILEKRLILRRTDQAFHADESLEPAELKVWVERIRKAEAALGKAAICPSDADSSMSVQYYRSICTLEPVRKGEMFTSGNLGGKRPGNGLPTVRLPEFWGRHAARDIPVNTLLTDKDAL